MSRKPPDTNFAQQRLKAFSPKLSINGLIFEFFIIGMIFIPLGFLLVEQSKDVVEKDIIYDAASGMDVDCSISVANAGFNNCTVCQSYHY
jgi:hypothetical protein